MRKFLFTLILIFISSSTLANKLFSSDWPVWNITEGMAKKGLLDGFDYHFKKYETTIKWFKAGNLDVTFMTLYDFISIQPTKVPTVILGVTDYSNGGDKIIFRNEIKKPTDLKGKKVVLATDTISLWLLHEYLIKHGMTLNDIQIVNKNPKLAPLLFRDNASFSAVVGWNPNIDIALNENSYVASTSADFPRSIYDLIVAKKDFVEYNPVIIKHFIADYYQSLTNDSIIENTAVTHSVSSAEYKSWLSDAKIFETQIDSRNERKFLNINAQRIVNFLTLAPDSLTHSKTIKRFKKRNLKFNRLIQFR